MRRRAAARSVRGAHGQRAAAAEDEIQALLDEANDTIEAERQEHRAKTDKMKTALFLQKQQLEAQTEAALGDAEELRDKLDRMKAAMLLQQHRQEALVAYSDLVLECNNPDVPASLLQRYLALYPQKRKQLIRSSE